jgi:hypothetical protein
MYSKYSISLYASLCCSSYWPKIIGPLPGKFLGIVGQDPSDSKGHFTHKTESP